MAPQPTRTPPPPTGQGTVSGVTIGAAAQVGVPTAAIAAALATAVSTGAGIPAVVDAGAEALGKALRALAALRVARIQTSLIAAGLAPTSIARVLARDASLEREFQRRSLERIRAGLRLALATEDPSARTAAIRSVLDRERNFARQRGNAQLSRTVGALERDALSSSSPNGAYWELGPAENHCSVCPLLAGKVWPWEVLNRLAIPLHYGCLCRLRSYGDAIASGLLTEPRNVVHAARALAIAKPIIEAASRLPGYGLAEEEIESELAVRERLLELGGNADFLAATPFSVDLGLAEAEAQTGAMVALYPPPEVATALALPDGEEPKNLHVTLAFLGEAGGPKSHAAAIAAVRRWAAACPPLEGEVSGTGRFVSGPKPVTYLSLDLPALPSERERLVSALDRAGVPPSREHGFTPHLTLDYANRRPKLDGPVEVSFDRVTLAWGDEHSSFPLGGETSEGLLEVDANPQWDPNEHPRDLLGRFRDAIDALAAGTRQTVAIDPITRVVKRADGTFAVVQHHKYHRGFESSGDAARAAFDLSAKTNRPDSIGGRAFKGGFDEYLTSKGIDPNEMTLSRAETEQTLATLRDRVARAEAAIATGDKNASRRLPFLKARRDNFERKLANGGEIGPGPPTDEVPFRIKAKPHSGRTEWYVISAKTETEAVAKLKAQIGQDASVAAIERHGDPGPPPPTPDTGDAASEPFDYSKLRGGEIVVDHSGKRWLVHGLARYAGGSGRTGRRTRGISVRPEEGGRARVLGLDNFATMELSGPLHPDPNPTPSDPIRDTRDPMDEKFFGSVQGPVVFNEYRYAAFKRDLETQGNQLPDATLSWGRLDADVARRLADHIDRETSPNGLLGAYAVEGNSELERVRNEALELRQAIRDAKPLRAAETHDGWRWKLADDQRSIAGENPLTSQRETVPVDGLSAAETFLRDRNATWRENLRPGQEQSLGATTPISPGDEVTAGNYNGRVQAVDRSDGSFKVEQRVGFNLAAGTSGLIEVRRGERGWYQVKPEPRPGEVAKLTIGHGNAKKVDAKAVTPELSSDPAVRAVQEKIGEAKANALTGHDYWVRGGSDGKAAAERLTAIENPSDLRAIGEAARNDPELRDALAAVRRPASSFVTDPRAAPYFERAIDLSLTSRERFEARLEGRKIVDGLRAEEQSRRASAVADALGKYRDGYGRGVFTGTSRSSVGGLVRNTSGFLPEEWTANVPMPKVAKIRGRAYFSSFERKVSTREGDPSTALHEVGHMIEHDRPAVLAAERRFYEERTSGEPLQRLKDLAPGQGYRAGEKSRPDEFPDPYIGKDYGGTAYELLSMGLERIFYDPNWATGPRYKDDLAFESWVLGILCGV